MIARVARARRRLAPVLALTLGAGALTVLAEAPAAAAVDRPFTSVFTANTNGSILLRGNSSMTCAGNGATCVSAKNAALDGTANNNNSFSMVYTDVDSVAATVNSSSATVTLPAGANVIFAGLYWAGDEKGATTLDKTKVKFATPRTAANTYNNITAVETTTSTANSGNATPYQSFADVTALVKAGGSGTYTVADIRAAVGTDKFAGWALAIAINDPAAPMRNLAIFDGFGVVQQSDPTVSIPVSGFQTPPAGTVKTQVGAVAYEGDFGYTGDLLQLNNTTLTNARNPANNSFNSTISEEGVVVAGRTPGDVNAFGVDIDRFQADGLIANGATSATLKLTTSSDTFYPGVVTFATDLYSPKLDITKTVTDVNGGSTEPGDVLQYTLDLKNNGQDSATLTRLLDAIPTNTSYVAGSLTLDGRALTDAADTDVGSLETAQGRVRVNLGSGATASAGGLVAVGATARVTFRVKIDAGLTGDVDIVNVAAADYTGAQTGLGISSVSNASSTAVIAPRADLRITKTSNPATVQRGQPVSYVLTVINDGPKPASGVVVTDTLPSGVVPTATSSQGSCTIAGSVATCAVGDMAVGQTVTITVAVASTSSAPDPLLDTATVTASTIDPNSANNTATANTVVNRAPEAGSDSAATDTNRAVTVTVLGNDSDPDNNALTVTGATINGTPNGVLAIGSDGRLTYTPNAGFAGEEKITYTVSDGRGGTATATVTITVRNAAPTAVNDATSTPPNAAVRIPVLANDTDPNIPGSAQTLSITGVTNPAQGGTATVDGNQIVYTPAAGFKGSPPSPTRSATASEAPRRRPCP